MEMAALAEGRDNVKGGFALQAFARASGSVSGAPTLASPASLLFCLQDSAPGSSAPGAPGSTRLESPRCPVHVPIATLPPSSRFEMTLVVFISCPSRNVNFSRVDIASALYPLCASQRAGAWRTCNK